MKLKAKEKDHLRKKDLSITAILKQDIITFDKYPIDYHLGIINDIYSLERKVQKYQNEFAIYNITYIDKSSGNNKAQHDKPACVQNYKKLSEKDIDMGISQNMKTIGNPEEEISSKYHPAFTYKIKEDLNIGKNVLFSSVIKLENINENNAIEEDRANGSSILEEGEIEGHNIESNLVLNEIDRLINLKDFYGEKLLKVFKIYRHIKFSSEQVFNVLVENIPLCLKYNFKGTAFKLYSTVFIETMFASINQELTEALYLGVLKDRVDDEKREVFEQIKGKTDEFDNKFYNKPYSISPIAVKLIDRMHQKLGIVNYNKDVKKHGEGKSMLALFYPNDSNEPYNSFGDMCLSLNIKCYENELYVVRLQHRVKIQETPKGVERPR